ncbi:hypothetical protein R5H30_10815 [Sulfitobacter sp. D35]|uniref:hypothetical protein n=1 Tax=Sulfitobacter sp. D35 TaxID=3083252 RepID=UPI00296EB96D|nr:hypothetical protein [Sulfitobacter sp. D35]MDW4498473.1 hypothetical protein [Sulfitobacter sp. D35]
MHTDLEKRRRVLVTTYRRYLDADRAWSVAQSEVKAWFPEMTMAHRVTIGDPGSKVRRLYDARSRAMLQFQTARTKLEAARLRLARREATPAPRLRLISLR